MRMTVRTDAHSRLAEFACGLSIKIKVVPAGHGTVEGMGEQRIERCGSFRPSESCQLNRCFTSLVARSDFWTA